jgi:hypothetical protein
MKEEVGRLAVPHSPPLSPVLFSSRQNPRKKKSMLKYAFAVAFMLCGWWMCRSAPGVAETKPENYFPLAVGNRWVYQSSEGTEAEPVLESWEVIRQEGNSFIVGVQKPFITGGDLEEQFALGSEGVQRRLPSSTTPESQFQLILKLPPAIGVTWQGADGRYTITAVGDNVTVPAGTFPNCVEVTRFHKETKVTEISTYAPGVGMIQREETFPVISGFGDFETRARGHTVLRLKEWKVNSQQSSVRNLE